MFLFLSATTLTCEDYSDLCYYEQENFNMVCFGNCSRYDPFGPSPIDIADMWEECGGKGDFTDRYAVTINRFIIIQSLRSI